MNNTDTKSTAEQTFFLSEVVKHPVKVKDKTIGKLDDFQITDKDKIAEVTHVIVSRPFGDPTLFVPWEKVQAFGTQEIVLDIESLEPFEAEPAEGAVFLRDHVLDKKVLDVEGREVEVVYDVKLAYVNKKLLVVGVDLSPYGLLRRIGLRWLADFIYSLAEKIRSQSVAWSYVQALPQNISTFKGDIRLKVLKERIVDMPPEDLADILEELDHDQRVALFSELDTEQASDTLEELDPHVQRDLIASLRKEKAALLINEMTPGQAADLLSVLPHWEVTAILKLLKRENALKVQGILEAQEEKIADYAVTDFLHFPPEMTAEQVRAEYQQAAKGKDVIMYIYILDAEGRLAGVLDLKELLRAQDNELLKDLMTSKVICLDTDSTLKGASEMFARYNFRALPIKDKDGKMLGVLPYRDVKNLKHLLF